MTPHEFRAIYNRLSVALRIPQDETGAELRVYYEALAAWPVEALEATGRAFAVEAGRRYFPTTAEWAGKAADYADQMTRLRLALPAPRPEPWRSECEACGDSGWVEGLTCDGGMADWPRTLNVEIGKARKTQRAKPAATFRTLPRDTAQPRPSSCGRMVPHLPHDYTQVCSCRATNHTYQRHQHLGYGA